MPLEHTFSVEVTYRPRQQARCMDAPDDRLYRIVEVLATNETDAHLLAIQIVASTIPASSQVVRAVTLGMR